MYTVLHPSLLAISTPTPPPDLRRSLPTAIFRRRTRRARTPESMRAGARGRRNLAGNRWYTMQNVEHPAVPARSY